MVNVSATPRTLARRAPIILFSKAPPLDERWSHCQFRSAPCSGRPLGSLPLSFGLASVSRCGRPWRRRENWRRTRRRTGQILPITTAWRWQVLGIWAIS